ncbi:MAG: phosphorylase [Methylobacter sp.]|nr:phosphorylase [Methylobacter sp.]
MITGIVVALPEEITTLTSKRIGKGNCLFITDKILVAYSGAGPENAQMAAELLVSKGVIQLISWGCAAALSPLLKPGDLTLAEILIDAECVRIDINSLWHNSTKNLLSEFVVVHTGHLAESKSLVSSSKDKKQLQSKTGAIALDMESIAVAKVATQHKLSFLAIRAIADPVTMSLPKAVDQSLNDQGEVLLGKLLLFTLLHPAELPGLIKLAMHFNAARKTLKRVAENLDNVIGFDHLTPTAI